MKIQIITSVLLVSAVAVMAQTPEPMKMKPEMTEIWDPEITAITPGESPKDAPSDAIVLFDGVNIANEWTNEKGEKPEWIVADGCVTLGRLRFHSRTRTCTHRI